MSRSNLKCLFWYVLTLPIRLVLVVVCAVLLITGICVLQIFGKQER